VQNQAPTQIPDIYAAFWDAIRQGREFYGLDLQPASDERKIENWLDLDYIAESFSREDMRLTLRDLFEAAHKVLMTQPPMQPETQAVFRELAFWNTVRLLAGFDVEDMAKTPQHAALAKHADAVWPIGLMVKEPGADEFVSAKSLLPSYGIGTPGMK